MLRSWVRIIKPYCLNASCCSFCELNFKKLCLHLAQPNPSKSIPTKVKQSKTLIAKLATCAPPITDTVCDKWTSQPSSKNSFRNSSYSADVPLPFFFPWNCITKSWNLSFRPEFEFHVDVREYLILLFKFLFGSSRRNHSIIQDGLQQRPANHKQRESRTHNVDGTCSKQSTELQGWENTQPA